MQYQDLKYRDELKATANKICTRGKGILAADESESTLGKKFVAINTENNVENRRAYRELLFTTPNLKKYISGVILFSETCHQSTKDGKKFIDVLKENDIIPGIKVDKGVQVFNNQDESFTKGLDSLAAMAKEYYDLGCRFAKWRAVLKIDAKKGFPSDNSIQQNCNGLAQYGLICQQNGLVPIIEPEILADGDHSIELSQQVTEKVLSYQFKALKDHGIYLEGCLLKPNMVTAGNSNPDKSKISNEEVAGRTLTALQRTVPPALVGVCFLSGGMSEEDASLNLNALNAIETTRRPWVLTFSYGRALQNSCVKTWGGNSGNVKAAQDALFERAKANGEAQLGVYKGTDNQAAKESLIIENYKY